MDGHSIAFDFVETEAVSSCSFILIYVEVLDQTLSYINHTSEAFHPSLSSKEILKRIIDYASQQIDIFLGKNISSYGVRGFDAFCFYVRNAKLIFGGTADDNESDEDDAFREAIGLLNSSSSNIQQISTDPRSRSEHLYQLLKNNVLILKPITWMMCDIDEEEGKPKLSTFR
jgi:hypothetical protein